MKKVTLEYMAGFFDGEGCVSVYKRNSKDRKKPYYLSQSILTNTNIDILKVFQRRFGGCIYTDKRNYRSANFKVHVWIVSSDKCLKFIKEIYPYTILKKEQIAETIEFQENPLRLDVNGFEANEGFVSRIRKLKEKGRQRWF